MNYNPQIHQRRSIRLPGYDYAWQGEYFITICVQDFEYLFGTVEHDQMILNQAGSMVQKWWQKIPEKFPDIAIGAYQTMPNHFHAIVINTGIETIGKEPLFPPSNDDPLLGEHMGSPLQGGAMVQNNDYK